MEESHAERTMSLMVDQPIPIVNTEYAYYVGELVPFHVAIYLWLYCNERYITSRSNVATVYNDLGLKHKINKITQARINLGFNNGSKLDEDLKNGLISILEH